MALALTCSHFSRQAAGRRLARTEPTRRHHRGEPSVASRRPTEEARRPSPRQQAAAFRAPPFRQQADARSSCVDSRHRWVSTASGSIQAAMPKNAQAARQGRRWDGEEKRYIIFFSGCARSPRRNTAGFPQAAKPIIIGAQKRFLSCRFSTLIPQSFPHHLVPSTHNFTSWQVSYSCL